MRKRDTNALPESLVSGDGCHGLPGERGVIGKRCMWEHCVKNLMTYGMGTNIRYQQQQKMSKTRNMHEENFTDMRSGNENK